jgi:hypothetical protein
MLEWGAIRMSISEKMYQKVMFLTLVRDHKSKLYMVVIFFINNIIINITSSLFLLSKHNSCTCIKSVMLGMNRDMTFTKLTTLESNTSCI